jgi:DNA end-binding protein Ku
VPQASWKGFIRLSLVSVPVQAFNATTAAKGDVSFNQLHGECHSRIKYQKTCPIHGEVSNSEIVKGFEYAKGQYVIVDEDELDKLRGESDQSVEISSFVKAGSIDPVYFEGRTYYLQPDGPIAGKPYAVLLDALSSKGLWGVAIATISNREQLVVLRAVDGALCIDTLHYAAELRGPAEIWGKLDLPAVGKEEARLAAALIHASTSKTGVDLTSFKDTYNTELRSLLEAKVEGKEVAAPKQQKREQVINLMDALKKSIAKKARVETAKRITRTSLSRSQGRKPTKRKSAG